MKIIIAIVLFLFSLNFCSIQEPSLRENAVTTDNIVSKHNEIVIDIAKKAILDNYARDYNTDIDFYVYDYDELRMQIDGYHFKHENCWLVSTCELRSGTLGGFLIYIDKSTMDVIDFVIDF